MVNEYFGDGRVETSGRRSVPECSVETEHRCTITTFPYEFGPEQLDSDRRYKTASGSLVPDGGPLVLQGTMSRAHRARRCWRALAKWQFEKATICTWAQAEATSSPLRVLLVNRAKVWYNKIVALMLRGPGLHLLHGARIASSARGAKCATGQKWSSASERRKLSCGETARAW